MPKWAVKAGVGIVAIVMILAVGHAQLNALYRDAKIEQNKTRIEKTEGTLGEHKETLTKHGNSLEAHQKLLEEHTQTLEVHEKQLGEHGESLERHEQRLGEHEAALEQQMGEVAKVYREIGEDRTEDAKQIAELSQRIEILEGQLKASQADLRQRSKVQENILERLKTLEENLPPPGN